MIPELSTAQWILGAACALLVGFSKTGVAGIGIVIVPIMAEVFDGIVVAIAVLASVRLIVSWP